MEKQKKSARGRYRQKECPYCGKMVGNLGNHVKGAHPTEKESQPAQTITKESLTEPWRYKEPVKTSQAVIYYCGDCKAEVRKGELNCWNCGEVLVWEGVKENDTE